MCADNLALHIFLHAENTSKRGSHHVRALIAAACNKKRYFTILTILFYFFVQTSPLSLHVPAYFTNINGCWYSMFQTIWIGVYCLDHYSYSAQQHAMFFIIATLHYNHMPYIIFISHKYYPNSLLSYIGKSVYTNRRHILSQITYKIGRRKIYATALT